MPWTTTGGGDGGGGGDTGAGGGDTGGGGEDDVGLWCEGGTRFFGTFNGGTEMAPASTATAGDGPAATSDTRTLGSVPRRVVVCPPKKYEAANPIPANATTTTEIVRRRTI